MNMGLLFSITLNPDGSVNDWRGIRYRVTDARAFVRWHKTEIRATVPASMDLDRYRTLLRSLASKRGLDPDMQPFLNSL